MRTAIKIIIALVVIGTGFGAYWWYQPAMKVQVGTVGLRTPNNIT